MSKLAAWSQLDAIATIGALPSGGVRRLAFTPADIQVRQQVQQWMQAIGMTVSIDAAGKMTGRYPGRVADAPALATGSHLDTIPNGRIYDGTYGVLARVVRKLR
ncbi:MAG: M20 family metallo-hydrolase [Cyanothece sp. SIO2G6]|nr:M20 family metallo-hydrolase [Cyanothece sp. SIO2G6]